MSKTTQRKPFTHKPYTRKPYVRQYAPPIPKEEGPRQAVLYSRVSSKEQAAEGYSIPAQQKILRTYAARHDLKVTREFVDVETAGHAGRSSFGEMLQWLKKHSRCKVILVEKTDRLYRNFRDYVELDDLHLELHFVGENAVISEGSRGAEKLLQALKVALAKSFLDNLSEDVHKGMLEKAEEGVYPSHAPVGYRNMTGPDGRKWIEVNPATAPLVRQLFEDYATGQYTLKDLSRCAAERGLLSRKTGQPYSVGTLDYVLHNPIYLGEFDWLGTRYPGKHPALVSREIWDRVQATTSERAVNPVHLLRAKRTFSGLVCCAPCLAGGHRHHLIGSRIKHRYDYYHCEGCKQGGTTHYVRDERLDEGFGRELRRLALRSVELGGAVIGLDGLWQLGSDWRATLARANRSSPEQEIPDHVLEELGRAVIVFTTAAAGAWPRLTSTEKRELLLHVVRESFWDGRALQVSWRRPYDLVAAVVEACATQASAPGRGSERALRVHLRALGAAVMKAVQDGDDLARVTLE